MASNAWSLDPDDPRSPSQEQWDAMGESERRRVLAHLPSEFPVSESAPPEGDLHFDAKITAKNALDGHFQRLGRRVYLACELPVYYPSEPMFAPDVFAVLDVERRSREHWTVLHEGKGLDFAMEILVAGRRHKDLTRNVERYARLGITEYFVFDRRNLRLSGFRLPSSKARVYQPILPQLGRYASQVLGLDLRLEDTRLRFLHGNAPVPDAQELIQTLEGMLVQVQENRQAAEQRAEEETRRREEETRRREELEVELARVRAELEALRGQGKP
jgi:Uma2 family endonuclease